MPIIGDRLLRYVVVCTAMLELEDDNPNVIKADALPQGGITPANNLLGDPPDMDNKQDDRQTCHFFAPHGN